MTLSSQQQGLCADCQWARLVQSKRGSNFLRCARSTLDSRFPKYPGLPVRRCDGYAPNANQHDNEGDEATI